MLFFIFFMSSANTTTNNTTNAKINETNNNVRLIKKYPNRRLYDTKNSEYITITDIKNLVLTSEAFIVCDAKTNEDLTRNILLQIILEEECGTMPLFSKELLNNFIRFYGSTMQGMFVKYLENTMTTFLDFQSKLQGENTSLQNEFWTQFFNIQQTALQNLMNTYVEQYQTMFSSLKTFATLPNLTDLTELTNKQN